MNSKTMGSLFPEHLEHSNSIVPSPPYLAILKLWVFSTNPAIKTLCPMSIQTMTGRCDNDSIYRLSKVKNTSGVVFIARGVVVIIVIPILRICLEEEFISALATRHRR